MDIKQTELTLLEMWKDSHINKIYRYKGRIKTLPASEGKTSFDLFYDLSNSLFDELKDVANSSNTWPSDVALSIDQLLSKRKGEVSKEQVLQRQLFKTLKQSLRQFIRYTEPKNQLNQHNESLVVINHIDHTAKFFQTERSAIDHINALTKEWEYITEGEDKDLEVIRFCTEASKLESESRYESFKFFRKINGVNYYRKRKHVVFEASVEYYPSL